MFNHPYALLAFQDHIDKGSEWRTVKHVTVSGQNAGRVAQVAGNFPRMNNELCIMLWNPFSRNRQEILVCDKMQYFRRRRKCKRADMSRRGPHHNLLVMSRRGGGIDLLATLAIFFSTVPLLVQSGKTQGLMIIQCKDQDNPLGWFIDLRFFLASHKVRAPQVTLNFQ